MRQIHTTSKIRVLKHLMLVTCMKYSHSNGLFHQKKLMSHKIDIDQHFFIKTFGDRMIYVRLWVCSRSNSEIMNFFCSWYDEFILTILITARSNLIKKSDAKLVSMCALLFYLLFAAILCVNRWSKCMMTICKKNTPFGCIYFFPLFRFLLHLHLHLCFVLISHSF